jgi:hypothetical protein
VEYEMLRDIIGAFGIITQGIKKSGNNTRKHSVDSLQKQLY